VRVIAIDSVDDPRLSFFTQLTDVALRRKLEPTTGLYLAESTKIIERALAAGHRPVSVLATEKWLPDLQPLLDGHDVDVFVGAESTLELLTGFHLHRGAIASMERPVLPTVAEIVEDARVVVVLENIVDHTNVGAIFRSVAGLGADAVLVTPDCADPFYRRSVRVSMGTVLQVPWTRIESWPRGIVELQELGFTVAALALSDDALSLSEFVAESHDKVAVVFGSEGYGLSSRALALCDRVVRIPMSHGVDSLNVAASAAVTLYALTNAASRS
jgi:tRNA G18 (ribose-2'-O)-methylase SpoU